MASTPEPVTIDRTYFETLVRRANFNNGDYEAFVDALAEQNLMVVQNTEYEQLMFIAHQFATLRSNLIAGGIDENTISLLSQEEAKLRNQEVTSQSTDLLTYQHDDHTGQVSGGIQKTKTDWNPEACFSPAKGAQQHEYQYYRGCDGKPYDNPPVWDGVKGDECSAEYSPDVQTTEIQQDSAFNNFGHTQPFDQPRYPRMCKRTIVLAGIADNTSHEDITKVVRGGLLLEVYIRTAEHSAHVSFLRGEDAVRFYDHSRKNDLYINHKRVFIKWADRHFHLAGHVAGKIVRGATRNMIIRRCDPNNTEDSIRDDLEHIHNLVVVKVEFSGGSCYIKTNSVHNAIFARTCMMSQIKYKGSKIEWDTDECEQPLETVPRQSHPKPQQELPKKPIVKTRNRFATLRLDDDDNAETDDIFDSSAEFDMPSTVDVTA
ncbi:hypothetical protein BKA67DRAFT_550948 [Truncatella angustata]|uniref:RRM domain-containing protein n=1 Tax=Truncatella angustata TaxID=152316 RepID=A0A9P9A4B4_9PEZI|nr:uncharacterized protein BKA67DRAFT_550948 [Truncatella angustata]KAH6661352.1 hypothetical protein BKA67DRAFT_550948 [Truncatella angustata]KAH8202171.1 hypothetical protein TruAng_003646 [Truncatella angustata]